MRRFSQRSHLVTLSEINITPLLDLAFVLLIIFIITTPLLEQSINLKLPQGGRPDQKLDKSDIRTVEITAQGEYWYQRGKMKLPQVEAQLVQDAKFNPNLVVFVRADRKCPLEYFAAVADCCQRNGIKLSMRTEPVKR